MSDLKRQKDAESHMAKHVNVRFQPPADLGTFDGDLVTGYSIFYACGPNCVKLLEEFQEDSESSEVKVIRGARPTSTIISGLRPGSDLAVQVFGTNDFGDGPVSNISLFRTNPSEPEAPNAPRSNLAERTSWSTFVSVLPCYDGGCPVTQFGFEIQEVSDGSIMQTPVWGTNPPDEKGYYFYSINTLRPGRIYKFRAFAVNEIGPSEWSEWSEELETHPFAPEAPTTPPCLMEPDAYNFTAIWDDIPGNGSPVKEWVIQWSVDPTFSSKNSIREAKVAERTHRCNRCLPGLVMHVRVAGINSEGQSHFGPSASIKTLYDKPVQCGYILSCAGRWVVDSRPVTVGMAAMALQKMLAEARPTPEEEVKVLEVEKEILDLCQVLGAAQGSLRRMGAFYLGVPEPNAELDLVFVLPERSATQPAELLEKLQDALPKAMRSFPQGSLNAPGLRWRASHARDVQLFLAKDAKPNPSASAPRAIPPSLAALYAQEVSSQILASVPSQETFRDLLRLVKHWAKRRGLYGKLFGFFDGTTWALCCARVCQLHPKGVLHDLLQSFFALLGRSDWSSPIALDGDLRPPVPGTLVQLPGNGYGPARAAHYELSESVMRVVQRELRRAEQKRVPELWAEHQFFNRHRHYIRFDFMASSDEILEKWWAWGQQQLPELLHIFESQLDSKVSLRPWPSSLIFKDESWSHAKAVFIGLHIQRAEQKCTLDLREIMVKFLEKISAWPEAETHQKQFELMIRALSSQEMQSWLRDQGSPGVKALEHEVMSPSRLDGYGPAMAATA
eukprot:s504_g19.t1